MTVPVPVVLAGVVQVTVVLLTTLTLVHCAPPIVTSVVVSKSVPVIVILVPPVVGPELGDMLVIVGALGT